MLEKVIEKVRALNEPNPCKFKAVFAPHTHTSDDVFMGDVGEWEGESLTDTLGAIVVMIEGKADREHFHTSEDVDEILGSTSHDGATLNEVIDAFDDDISTLQTTVAGLQTEVDGKANVNHSQAISTITGLQNALDNKIPAALGHVSMSERINITGLKDGLTYLLDSTTAKSLSDVLVSPYTIRYSRNDVGANKKFLIRVYTYSLGSFSYVEIVDAWS